ncbi:MAG: hypothetical protein ACUVQP_03675 [Bacteroidales bacterium]
MARKEKIEKDKDFETEVEQVENIDEPIIKDGAHHGIKEKEVEQPAENIDVSSAKINYIEGDQFNMIYYFLNTNKKDIEVRIAGKIYNFKSGEIIGFTSSAVRPIQNYNGIKHIMTKVK